MYAFSPPMATFAYIVPGLLQNFHGSSDYGRSGSPTAKVELSLLGSLGCVEEVIAEGTDFSHLSFCNRYGNRNDTVQLCDFR